MADVFVSYRRDDKARVHRLVAALRNSGLPVWWDDDIPPDAPWETTIESALAAAKVVIVAWSKGAVLSENVKGEARRARRDGKLIQIFLEPCEPPLFFGERQGVDLDGWSGSETDSRFESLAAAATAVRDGKAPPAGVGHIPKRRSRWPFLVLVPLLLMSLPVALDWQAGVRVAILVAVGAMIWRGGRIAILSACAAGVLLNVGLDVLRYRFPSRPYYAVECGVGNLDCFAARTYKFGKRNVDLFPLAGGALQQLYARGVAGEGQFARSALRREQVGDQDALLSPAEMALLSYLDGGSPSKQVTITYQPLSRKFDPSFPYGRALVQADVEFSPRPDILHELVFSAGMVLSGEDMDYFDPATLRNYAMPAPAYTAQRSSPSSLGFATPIDTHDQPALWRRAVVSDQLFQLYASDNLDETLSDLSADYPVLPDADRTLYDTLVLSYWCSQNAQTAALIACASEMSRIALEIDRQLKPVTEAIPPKLLLAKQILRLVGNMRLQGLDAEGATLRWAQGLSSDAYSTADEMHQILLRDLVLHLPALKPYLARSEPSASVKKDLLLNAVTVSDEAFEEYVKGVTGLGRSDALQVLLPLRGALAAAYADASGTGPDIFAWGRAVYSDLSLAGERKITPSSLPQTYGLIKQGIEGSEARRKTHDRYDRIDAAVAAMGGFAPLELVSSRENMKRAFTRDTALKGLFDQLAERIENGTTLDELQGALDSEDVRKTLLPIFLETMDEYAAAADTMFDDAGLPQGRACVAAFSDQLAILERNDGNQKDAISRTIKTLLGKEEKAGDSNMVEDFLTQHCPELVTALGAESTRTTEIYRFLADNPVLRNPQDYLAAEASRGGLVSSRQFALSTAYETLARVVEAADWIAVGESRVAAWNNGLFYTGVDVAAADYADFRKAMCAQWREPYWAYSEMDNATLGWRRLPLFFSLLRMSDACDGKATPTVRASLESRFGAAVVEDYLAAEEHRDNRIQVQGRIEPGALETILASEEWSFFDAYSYAQASLFRNAFDDFANRRLRTTRGATFLNAPLCAGQACDQEQVRLVTVGLNAFFQSSASASVLKDVVSERSLFSDRMGVAIDEDTYEDLVAAVLPTIPAAFAEIRLQATTAGLKPIADALLRKPTAKEFAVLEKLAAQAPMTAAESDTYWLSVHSIFGKQQPLLAVAALDRVKASGLQAEGVAIRKSQLFLRAGKHTEASEIAIGLLDDFAQSADIVGIRLALENGLQVFTRTSACLDCRERLAPRLFNSFARLDELHGDTAEDRFSRIWLGQACVKSQRPVLVSAAVTAADAIMTPLIAPAIGGRAATSNPFDIEFLESNSAVAFALDVKLEAQRLTPDRGNDAAVRVLLDGLASNDALQPTASTLSMVNKLSAALPGDRRTLTEPWIERASTHLGSVVASTKTFEIAFEDDVASLVDLAGPGEARVIALADGIFTRLAGEYDHENYATLSPLRAMALFDYFRSDTHGPEKWKLPDRVIGAYLRSAGLTDLAKRCDDEGSRCDGELFGLWTRLENSTANTGILSETTRANVMALSRHVVASSPHLLETLTDALAREFGERRTTVLADLIRDRNLRGSAFSYDLHDALAYLTKVVRQDGTMNGDAETRARAFKLQLRLIEMAVEDYLPAQVEQGCCSGHTPVTEDVFVLLSGRLNQPDACQWLEATGLDAGSFIQQRYKGAALGSFNLPLLVKLQQNPETACAGSTYSDTIAKLDVAIRLNAKDVAALYSRGRAYEALHNYPRAFADYDQASAASPESEIYQNKRCWSRAGAGLELDVARAACDSALIIAPRSSFILDSRGLVGLKQARFQDAWNDFDTAAKLDPKSASARYGRGIASLRLGKSADGYADLAAANQMDPGIRQIYADLDVSIHAASQAAN